MKEVFFVGDESGFHGKADKLEQRFRQIGLFGGVIIPGEQEVTLRKKIFQIATKYFPSGKPHFTDLYKKNSTAAGELRRDIYSLIKKHQLNCIYAAASVEGFHQNFQKVKKQEKEAEGMIPEHIVNLNPRHRPERLHTELFEEAFSKVVAWSLDAFGEDNRIVIHARVDNVEQTILDEFRDAAQTLIGSSLDKTIPFSYYDKQKKREVNPKIIISVKGGDLYGPLDNIRFTLEVADARFTLLADVVTNSLFDHIQEQFADEKIVALNGPDAVRGHPLSDYIYGLSAPEGSPTVTDTFYSHPGISKHTE